MKGIKISLLGILLLLLLIVASLAQDIKDNTRTKLRDNVYNNVLQWKMEVWKYVDKKVGIRSNLPITFEADMKSFDEKYFAEFGLNAFPYLLCQEQNDAWMGGVLGYFSKFKWQDYLDKEKKVAINEEFDKIAKGGMIDAREMFLNWWLYGKEKTPIWFNVRYTALSDAVKAQNSAQIKALYKKLTDIGIASIPLLLNKLNNEDNEQLQGMVIEALVYLTDRNINTDMSKEEINIWWDVNKDKWTIPFPNSTNEFLTWLEEETNSGIDVWALSATITTISRIKDEKAIDLLIKLLKHPKETGRVSAMHQLQMLFGNQLPEEYSLHVENDDWESYRDLDKLNAVESVKKKLYSNMKISTDLAKSSLAADAISNWWLSNKETAKIHWERAWINIP